MPLRRPIPAFLLVLFTLCIGESLMGQPAQADVGVTKTDSPDPVIAGANLTYTITVTNAGPGDAANVSLSDTLPAGTTFVSFSQPEPGDWVCSTPVGGMPGTVHCTLATFPATGSTTFTLVVNVDPSVAYGTTVSNTATVMTASTDPNAGNNSATATTTVSTTATDLSISKSDTPTDPVVAGQNVTYTIAVQNNGPNAATNAAMMDTLPTGTTFVSASAPAGWTCTTPAVGSSGAVTCTIPSFSLTSAVFTIVARVDPSRTGSLTNTANISSETTELNSANDTAIETTTVNALADLQVTKSDTPDPVTASSDITYTITVTNAGPSTATPVTLTDVVPPGTTFLSVSTPSGWFCSTPGIFAAGTVDCSTAFMLPGAVAAFTLRVAVAPSLAPGTVVTNTATAASPTPDPNSGNNSATTTTSVGAGSANLSITKTDSPDPVNAGAFLTYTVNVHNAGPTNAANVTMTDVLPANTTFTSMLVPTGWTCTTPPPGSAGTVTCTRPSLGAGTMSFSLIVRVLPSTAAGTVITNTATVTSATADPVPGNESATTSTAVVVSANVTGTKSVTGSFSPGGAITYTIVLTNSGSSLQGDNPGNELLDVLPASLVLVSASATRGTAVATPATRTVTWNGSIAAGTSVTITINATVAADAMPGTIVNNQGTIRYDLDGNGTNESSRQTDSPAQPGPADPTPFTVAPATFEAIPTLDEMALLTLAVLLAAVAALVLKR